VREVADALPDALRADAHHWAAHFYRDTGRMEAAEMFARETITLEECAGRTVSLANHRMFLAQLLEDQGELHEALAQAELALDAERAAMGAEHAETRYYASVVTKLRRRLGGGWRLSVDSARCERRFCGWSCDVPGP
jgi:hypothetical protein